MVLSLYIYVYIKGVGIHYQWGAGFILWRRGLHRGVCRVEAWGYQGTTKSGYRGLFGSLV